MHESFNNRVAMLLSQSKLVDGVDRVCMSSGLFWSIQRKRDYERQFGPVPDWVLKLHLHLRSELCGIALEVRRPLPLNREDVGLRRNM